MRYRLAILAHWLRGRRNGVSFPEIVRFMFRRPGLARERARAMIRKVEEKDGYHLIHLEGCEVPLYYPGDLPLRHVEIALLELCLPDSWHCYEAEETRVACDDVVVDCGAAEGLFSLTVARRCRQVYAIEPLPAFVESMRRTFSGIPNVEILPVGLSDQDGLIPIREDGMFSSLDDRAVGPTVRVCTLDSLFYDRGIPVTYIKGDLEGYEPRALRGAAETIRAWNPRISITTYHDPEHEKILVRLLGDLVPGYRFRLRGITTRGHPVMLHAWVP